MPNAVPLLANNFNVYIDDYYQPGVAEGNFPSLEFMTSEIKGSGVAGTIDMPAPGHFGSFTVSLTWRTISPNYAVLGENRSHTLDMYAEHLDWDGGRGEYISRSVHVFMKALTKKMDLGKLVVGESAEAQTEHEVFYFKLDIDNSEQILIDKLNYIYRVQGEDFLAGTRRALGRM